MIQSFLLALVVWLFSSIAAAQSSSPIPVTQLPDGQPNFPANPSVASNPASAPTPQSWTALAPAQPKSSGTLTLMTVTDIRGNVVVGTATPGLGTNLNFVDTPSTIKTGTPQTAPSGPGSMAPGVSATSKASPPGSPSGTAGSSNSGGNNAATPFASPNAGTNNPVGSSAGSPSPGGGSVTTLPAFLGLKSTLSTNYVVNSRTVPLVIQPGGRVALPSTPNAAFTSAMSSIGSKSGAPLITTANVFSTLKTTISTHYVESSTTIPVVIFPSGRVSMSASPNAAFSSFLSSMAPKPTGSTASATSNAAPKTSASSSRPTAAVVSLPTRTSKYSVSIQSLTTSIPGVTGNTIIDTTAGADHHSTRVPVLWRCRIFCPPGGGLALFGGPTIPGVYPPPTPPPSKGFPSITIGSNSIPTISVSRAPTSEVPNSQNPSSSASSSSSSCSKKTVSECGVKCTGKAQIRTQKITYSRSCSTACSKVTDCKATGTTTTSRPPWSSWTGSIGTYTEMTTESASTTAGPAEISKEQRVIAAFKTTYLSSYSSFTNAHPTGKVSSTSKKASSTSKKASSSSTLKTTTKASASFGAQASKAPVCNPLNSNKIVRFGRDAAIEGIKKYCAALRISETVLSERTKLPVTSPLLMPEQILTDEAEGDANITFIVQWASTGCNNPLNPVLNFRTLGDEKCIANFQHVVDGCPLFTRPATTMTPLWAPPMPIAPPPAQGIPETVQYWKVGGSWYNNCGYWSVIATNATDAQED